MALIHGTCVAIGGRAVLMRGPSGSGKSDLALRLIDGGAQLVADDYVAVTAEKDRLRAASPQEIAGKMEVRGLGLVELPYRGNVVICLVADLCGLDKIERYPDPLQTEIEGCAVPLIRLWAFEASAAAKLKMALAQQHDDADLDE